MFDSSMFEAYDKPWICARTEKEGSRMLNRWMCFGRIRMATNMHGKPSQVRAA
jgi:hypothetical protein